MFLQEKINEINEKLKALESSTNVVIWGAGVHTCKLFEKTDLFSYHIKAIVDIDNMKQGNRYFGFNIENPEKIAWEDIDAVVISVPGKENQVTEMLEGRLGYKGDIISLYENGKCTPFYLLYDEKVSEVRYLGDYDNWNTAHNECKGYDDTVIIDKVISSVGKVLAGEAVWERDSYLFYEQKYVYSICAAILRCAVQNGNQGVRILDVGGGIRKYLFPEQGVLGRY